MVDDFLVIFLEQFQAELLECDERAGRKYLHQIEELRDQFEREKETVSIRERELAQTR